jgi:hypothetical protein
LIAGLRLALFLRVRRLAFRIDLAQLLLLVLLGAAINVFVDAFRVSEDARFTWFGAGSEFFSVGFLILVAVVQALLFRERALALAIPVLALAAYPVVQLAHLVPLLSPALWARAPLWADDVFDIGLDVWALVLFVRVVAVALGPAPRHRWVLATVGGVMIMAGIYLSPALLPTQGWWHPASVPADGRYPNPASEPVLAAQATLLDDALSNLDDATEGQTDLYFVGFGSDARDEVYRQDILAAQRVMDEKWDTRDRSIVLLNSPATLLDTPMATVTNLRETLKEIAAAINTDEDVVMVYLAGPSERDGSLLANLPPLELVPLSPGVLKALFDEAGIAWRIIVVSSCHGEAFVDALKSDTTIVLAAADDTSGACTSARDATRLGAALFGDALSHAESLQQALEAAQAAVAGNGGTPGAKLHVGPQIATKVRELDRRRATRGASRTV